MRTTTHSFLTALLGAAVMLSACKKNNDHAPSGGGNNEPDPPTSNCPAGSTVTDVDGNVYPVVQIGGQCWMAKNLRTAHYRDGGEILHAMDDSTWYNTYSTGTNAWCNYNNDAANDTIYGKLYNGYAAANPNICPLGWHVPTDAEWKILETTLGMPADELDFDTGGLSAPPRGVDANVGGKMKSTTLWNWVPPFGANTTNESGFSALPGGGRTYIGEFFGTGNGYNHEGRWWCSNEGFYRSLGFGDGGIGRSNAYSPYGFCIRCLRD